MESLICNSISPLSYRLSMRMLLRMKILEAAQKFNQQSKVAKLITPSHLRSIMKLNLENLYVSWVALSNLDIGKNSNAI